MDLFEKVEGVFDIFVNYLILLVELVGIFVLIYAVISSVIGLFRHEEHVRLKLAEGIALSLEFKMGGELLRTVIVREWKELLILGAIILIRAALAFLIQWEIKIERRSGNMSDSQLHNIKSPLLQKFKRKKQTKSEVQENKNVESNNTESEMEQNNSNEINKSH